MQQFYESRMKTTVVKAERNYHQVYTVHCSCMSQCHKVYNNR